MVFYYDFGSEFAQKYNLMPKKGAFYSIQFGHLGKNRENYQTFPLLFDTNRLGDTVVVTSELLDSAQEPGELQYAAYWKSEMNKAPKDREYGPLVTVTASGSVAGEKYISNQPKAQKLSKALHDYLLKRDPYSGFFTNEFYFTKEKNLEICKSLGVTAQEVYNQYADDYAAELEQGVDTTPSLDLVADRLGLKDSEIKDTKVYFEFPASVWKNYKLKINKRKLTNVYAYVKELYGDSEYPKISFGNSAWYCSAKDDDPNTMVFYYDFAGKTAKNNNLMLKEGADYTIQFSHNGYETFALTFDTSRLGDTVIVTDKLLETPDNPSKLQYAAYWKSEMNKSTKEREYGSAVTVTSRGRIVGEKYSKNQPKAQKLSTALHDYLLNNYGYCFTKDRNIEICKKLGVTSLDVYKQYVSDYETELEQGLATTPKLEVVKERLGFLKAIVKGDVDDNGIFNIYDLTLLQRYFAEMAVLDSRQLAAADFNCDNKVNVNDIIAMQRALAN